MGIWKGGYVGMLKYENIGIIFFCVVSSNMLYSLQTFCCTLRQDSWLFLDNCGGTHPLHAAILCTYNSTKLSHCPCGSTLEMGSK